MTDFNYKPKLNRTDWGCYNQAYLPHFDAPQKLQFVTFRLFDSMPQTVLDRFRTEATQNSEFRKSIEHYLDSGFGECWLRRKDIAEQVRDALKFNDKIKYDLISWVIMPNHVHLLLTPKKNVHLPNILHSIKSFTAQMANKLLQRNGQFWQHESFDRYIRNYKHFAAVVRYIEQNPVKAGLCDAAEEWTFSSAFEMREKH